MLVPSPRHAHAHAHARTQSTCAHMCTHAHTHVHTHTRARPPRGRRSAPLPELAGRLPRAARFTQEPTVQPSLAPRAPRAPASSTPPAGPILNPFLKGALSSLLPPTPRAAPPMGSRLCVDPKPLSGTGQRRAAGWASPLHLLVLRLRALAFRLLPGLLRLAFV